MGRTATTIAAVCVALAALTTGQAGATAIPSAAATPATPATPGATIDHDRLGRAILEPNDGWAAAEGGTTGGSAATAEQVFTVGTRSELVAALGGDNATNATNATPKIIYVRGTIDLRVDADDQPLDCTQLADPAYSIEAYLAAYDPATWGRVPPTGPLEDARVRSTRIQSAVTRINVGPNTTIVGIGRDARITHGGLMLGNVTNVIVRNIEFSDAFDCFPAWSPTDGAAGNWNALYDNVSLSNAQHVWVDHCTFNDGDSPDSERPVFFGRPHLSHDGLLDVIRGSDFVTASYNDFHDHDKGMLIGSTDNPSTDLGKLRVTLHHNRFADVVQRGPRVRFGQVHAYNNLYVIPNPDHYSYSWGVGVQSQLFVENNYVVLGEGVAADTVVRDWGGTAMTERGTYTRARPVSFLAQYNATHDPDIGADAGWTPTLHRRIAPTLSVPLLVWLFAGAGRPIAPN